MGNKSIARPSNLPLGDSSFIGDTILEEVEPCGRNKSRLKAAIRQLKELISSANKGINRLDEDELIECLFSRVDVDYENREYQQELPLLKGNTYAIRTTEVIDNVTGQERYG